MNKEKLDRIFRRLTLLLLIVAAFLTFSNTSIAKIINTWQAGINHGKFYPALTLLLLVLPFLLIMLPLKLFLLKRIKQQDAEQNNINHKNK